MYEIESGSRNQQHADRLDAAISALSELLRIAMLHRGGRVFGSDLTCLVGRRHLRGRSAY